MPPGHPLNHQIELQLLKTHPVLSVPIWALLLTIQMFSKCFFLAPTHSLTHTQSAHAHLHEFGHFPALPLFKVEYKLVTSFRPPCISKRLQQKVSILHACMQHTDSCIPHLPVHSTTDLCIPHLPVHCPLKTDCNSVVVCITTNC
jgi:hypothetical protein